MTRFKAGWIAATAIFLTQVAAFGNDEQIAKLIADRLQAQQAAAKLKDFNIGVQVDQGTVTIMGQVADAEQAMTALDIARRVPGVKLVVNDLFVRQTQDQQVGIPTPATAGAFAGQVVQTGAILPIGAQSEQVQSQVSIPQPEIQGSIAGFVAPEMTPIGTGLSSQPTPAAPVPFAVTQRPLATSIPQTLGRPQQPVAFAPSQAIRMAQASQQRPIAQANFMQGSASAPMQMGVPGGIAQANFDQPQLPGYSWPSYSAHPNYGAVTYPHQYSATAWPYIGPFYPYPQVPLGWRKVSLEWDDGWWFLDFKSK